MLLATVVLLIAAWIAITINRARIFYAQIDACFSTSGRPYKIAYSGDLDTLSGVFVTMPAIYTREWAGTRYIGGAFASVERVTLSEPHPSEVSAVAQLKGLKSLTVFGPLKKGEVDWKGVGRQRIEDLTLRKTGIRDSEFRELMATGAGARINIADEPALSAAGFAALTSHRGLSELAISADRGETVAWRQFFERLPPLSFLFLSGRRIDDSVIAVIAARQVRLRTVFLTETRISDNGLLKLAGLPSFDFVVVRGGQLSRGGVKSFCKLNRPKRLMLGECGLDSADADDIRSAFPFVQVALP